MTEMIRVSSRLVFISDHNIYGWGSKTTTTLKRLIRSTLGFRALKFLITRGRGYHDTDYDGVFYPFSLLDHIAHLNRFCDQKRLVVTSGIAGENFHRVSHLAYLGEKNA